MMTRPKRRTSLLNQRGSALVTVLWIALLLSILLAGAIAVVRVEVRSVYAAGEGLKARTAAQSGLEIAAMLMATGDVSSVEEMTRLKDVIINDYKLEFSHSIESQKLDINLASEEAFAALFEFVGVKPVESQKLAARIADWRDEDDLSRPNGAERTDYAAAKHGEKIGNRAFRSVRELKAVIGFPETLYDCVSPSMTVLGATGLPDRELMTTLFGGTPFETSTTPSTRLGTAGRAPQAGKRVAVTVKAISSSGRQVEQTAIFRVTGGSEKPYEFIAVYENLPDQPLNAGICSSSRLPE